MVPLLNVLIACIIVTLYSITYTLCMSMEICRQQDYNPRRSPEPQVSPASGSLSPRKVLRETNSNPQIHSLETTNPGQAKHAVVSQLAVASVLEQRQKARAHTRQPYRIQRSPRYQQYRGHSNERVRKALELGQKPDEKWPDEIEYAFIEGMTDCWTRFPSPSSQKCSSLQDSTYREEKAIDSSQTPWQKRADFRLHQDEDRRETMSEASLKPHSGAQRIHGERP
jgi:hypothetical protein